MSPIKLPSVPSLHLGRRTGAEVIGLDIQPGLIAAVKARVNGSILAERAGALPLAADIVREGEVVDVDLLSDALRELFATSHLPKRVRVGVANQRTVMRTLELPPVTDRKELAAVVQFQAQDQVPMPLSNAVLDFHPLGVVESPAGPRQRVVLVAAQRDMVERLLAAVRGAGLDPIGVDLSAFALIRSLHQSADDGARVLYLNVDGLTNLAIAEGTTCLFTRVIGGGLEGMASELAERRAIPLAQAREMLLSVDLNSDPEPEPETLPGEEAVALGVSDEQASGGGQVAEQDATQREPVLSPEDHERHEAAMAYSEAIAVQSTETPAGAAPSISELRAVIENGIRDISGEVRNSLDFHRTQGQGGEVSHVVLSGAALDLSGFAEALQQRLGMEVLSASVGLTDANLADTVSTHRLTVAAGLAATEAPQ